MIAGFPGEGEQEFAETVSFVQKMAFSKMHIFPFSPRRGTIAYDLGDQVPDPEKKKRAKILAVIDEKMQASYGERFIGRELSMLKEQKTEIGGEGFWSGHSENYLHLFLPDVEEDAAAAVEEKVTGIEWHKNCLYVKSRKNRKNAEN